MLNEEALLRRTPVKYKKARVYNGGIKSDATGKITMATKGCPLEVKVGDRYFLPDYNERKDEDLGYFIEVTNDSTYPEVDIGRLRLLVVGDLTETKGLGDLLQTLYKQHLNGFVMADIIDEAMLLLNKYSPETFERIIARSEQYYQFDLGFITKDYLPKGVEDISIIITDQDGTIKSKTHIGQAESDDTVACWNGLFDHAYLETTFTDEQTGESERSLHALFPSIGSDLSVEIMLIRADAEKIGRLFVDQNDNLHAIKFNTFIRGFLGIALDDAIARYYCKNHLSPLCIVAAPGEDSAVNGDVAGYAFVKSNVEKHIAVSLDDYLRDIQDIVDGNQEIETTFIPNSEA